MAGIARFDEEMQEFYQNFKEHIDKRIVLYGTGRFTSTIIEKNREFQIVGVCDRDPELVGKKIYGLPVLSQKQAEQLADIVIINTSSSYWYTIYERIASWKLPVYYRNGERAKKLKEMTLIIPIGIPV